MIGCSVIIRFSLVIRLVQVTRVKRDGATIPFDAVIRIRTREELEKRTGRFTVTSEVVTGHRLERFERPDVRKLFNRFREQLFGILVAAERRYVLPSPMYVSRNSSPARPRRIARS